MQNRLIYKWVEKTADTVDTKPTLTNPWASVCGFALDVDLVC